MAVVTDAQLAAAARDAGIPADQIATAVAIALAESGGDTLAHNTVPPDNSYGAWQINMYGNLGPQRRKQFGLNSNQDLFNLATNARAMAAISNKGQNWKPWSTFMRGSHLRFLNRGKAAAGGVGTGSVTTPVTNSISDPLTYRKAALYVAGVVLILIGVIALFRLQRLIPLGRLGKVVK